MASVLEEILAGPQPSGNMPPTAFLMVIQTLMDRSDATNEGPERPGALALLNAALLREGYSAFYGDDGLCYLRHVQTNTLASPVANPQRPLSKTEIAKRAKLAAYIEGASEDSLIEEILLPLFRHIGFRRITASGHKDKALEYGKDIWMKFTLPTAHCLYFGIQAKRGKLDAAGMTRNTNMAEILAQIRMMLGHKLFDPEINKRVLIDHAIIVAGGEITKQARNWLGEQLDQSSRSQILFMERDDILDLCIVNNVPLNTILDPAPSALTPDDGIPF
ncbi:hypothetical protein [Myxococcus stipitatus]|uniref:hypothetical protein n=1 Tax=Myxococcus stipitatus TaxID=83455 RepID=UPI0030CF2908